ncbi:MAG: hypothetical protein L0Y58_02425 [Verrucomicrobia subdivision 3 bacterium]|nr:hypothetical protein [Limisphaerales bacterium]
MSLINDALKKASQNAPPPQVDAAAPPYRPAVHETPPRWPLFVVPPLAIAVLALGALLLVRGWRGSRPEVNVTAHARESGSTQRLDAAKPVEPDAANTIAPSNSTVALAPTNVAAAAPSAPSVATFPTLKVQGIFWRPTRPSVLINNKTLFVGEKIDRIKVIAIDQESVTIEWNDEQRVLTLP